MAAIDDLEFEQWMNEHGMEVAAPLPDLLNGLIMLITDALGSHDMREFLREFLRELVQVEPDMPLLSFAGLVRNGLNADLTKLGGGFLPEGAFPMINERSPTGGRCVPATL